MPFEHYRYAGTELLRCGYTTGTCAALAAAAAVEALLTGRAPTTASIVVPAGIEVEAPVENVEFPVREDGRRAARCSVRKDAGDDVDATDGIEVCAQVHLNEGTGGVRVRIDGGTGVGRVTKPGLDQPVGAAAINSGPRAMIEGAVADACARLGFAGDVDVLVEVPEGAAIARQTFNPRLGIEGGISILGTTGIVEPRSLAALADTIELEVRALSASGGRDLVLVPGNYGEAFAAGTGLLGLAPHVACANFVGLAIDCAVREGMERVLLVGHLGKLAKVAAGVMDTHSRVADCRVEVLAAHAGACGAPAACIGRLFDCATTDACIDVLLEEGTGLVDAVLDRIASALQARLDQRAQGRLEIGAVVFSLQHDLVRTTSGARSILAAWGFDAARLRAGRP